MNVGLFRFIMLGWENGCSVCNCSTFELEFNNNMQLLKENLGKILFTYILIFFTLKSMMCYWHTKTLIGECCLQRDYVIKIKLSWPFTSNSIFKFFHCLVYFSVYLFLFKMPYAFPENRQGHVVTGNRVSYKINLL